jgi:hypothetical protein
MTEVRKRRRPKGGRKIVARGTPARWGVAWHPKALDEKNTIEDVAERVAIAHVIEKLEVDGPALRSPHQSGVKADEALFAILAIGPEAEIEGGLCQSGAFGEAEAQAAGKS